MQCWTLYNSQIDLTGNLTNILMIIYLIIRNSTMKMWSARCAKSLLLRMDRYTKVNGINVQIKKMAEEYKYGQTDRDMMVSGKMMLHKVMEDSYMLREMSMKDNGKMTKLMDMAFILTIMVTDMLVTGKKISSMEKAWKSGLMIHNMTETIKME